MKPGLLGPGFVLGFLVAAPICFLLFSGDQEVLKNEGLVGAILGSIVAGAISILAQIMTFRHSAQIDSIKEKNVERVVLQGIFLQLLHYIDYVRKLNSYYRTFEERNIISINNKPILHKALRGDHRVVTLSLAEKSVIIDLKNVGFFNRLLDLEGMSSALELLHTSYRSKLDSFEEKQRATGQVQIQGKLVMTAAPPDHLSLAELVDLLDQLQNALKEAVPQAQQALVDVSDLLHRYDRKIELDLNAETTGEAKFSSEHLFDNRHSP